MNEYLDSQIEFWRKQIKFFRREITRYNKGPEKRAIRAELKNAEIMCGLWLGRKAEIGVDG